MREGFLVREQAAVAAWVVLALAGAGLMTAISLVMLPWTLARHPAAPPRRARVKDIPWQRDIGPSPTP